MKKILSILLIFHIISISAQTNIPISIPGTKLSIVPPTGFVLSSNFSGFQNTEKGSSIMINEMPSSYYEMSEAFDQEALKSQGMILIKKETIDFKGNKATYFNVSQKANGITYLKQILMFGDEAKTILINGIYPENFENLKNDIKTSIFSASYNENQKDNPLEAVKFMIDVSDTQYKFVKYISGSLLYSEDGKIPTDKGIIMVGNSISKISTTDLKQYSIDRLKKLPNGENSKIISINDITIANLQGYEITANNNKNELVYQVMLYTKEFEYFLIIGQAFNDKEASLNIFKKIAKTFKLK